MIRHNGKPAPDPQTVQALLRVRRKLTRMKYNGYLIRKRRTK